MGASLSSSYIALTVISGAPTDDGGPRTGEGLALVSDLWQADGYNVGRAPYRPVELEDRDVVVKAYSRELGVRVDLLHVVGFRRRWLVVALEIDVTQTHGELTRQEAESKEI